MSDPLDPMAPTQKPTTAVEFLDDAQRREKLGDAFVGVAKATALFALIAQYAPNPALKAVGLFFSGLQRDPYTGALRPSLLTLGNLAPVPLGYLAPDAVGLKPNWWLPNGITDYLPSFVDRLGIGIPQQRAEDKATKLVEAQLNEARRQNVVSHESNDTLADLVAGSGGFTRAGELFATASFGDAQALQRAAAAELNRRASVPSLLVASLPNIDPLAEQPPPISAGGGGDYGGGGGDPLDQAVAANGSGPRGNIDPLQAVAVQVGNNQQTPGVPNALQQEAMRRAPELLRQLLTERTDP